jgi:hypothetical protein
VFPGGFEQNGSLKINAAPHFFACGAKDGQFDCHGSLKFGCVKGAIINFAPQARFFSVLDAYMAQD